MRLLGQLNPIRTTLGSSADETGTRTFALPEIMVRQAWTGKGIAHALHDELLSGRNEERATLLVRPDNHTASTAYKRWDGGRSLNYGLAGPQLHSCTC